MAKLFIALVLLTGVGDSASYSRVGSCTSSFIRSIDVDIEVASETESAFKLDIDYDIRTRFARRRGDSSKTIDKYLFTEEFLIELRETGHYETDDFKVDHNGRRDGDCDLVRIYDLDDLDGEVDAKICYGQPVLGIVEAEVNGNLSGVGRFRACVELD